MTDKALTGRLKALIASERAALLLGDFDRLADLFEEKQRLAEELATQSPIQADLQTLREGIRRNRELFDHAMAGLRNVAARLGDLDRVRRSTDTYDAQGRRLQIDIPSSKRLERRA